MTELVGPGALVAVVGASGAGKDTLIDYARARVDGRAVFPRRVVTRPAGPGEDHEPMDEQSFAEACQRDAFALTWRAHGLLYGIPAAVDTDVRSGRVVVVNVSRTVLDLLANRYARLVVVHVSVSEDVRIARLHARGRESTVAVRERLARPAPAPERRPDLEIRNDGPIEHSGAQLVQAVLDAAL